MTDPGLFLGRFHPLIVHLPIGILIAAAVLHVLSRAQRFRALAPAVRLTLVLGAVGAAASAATGYLLGASGGYSGETFARHQLSGFAVLGASVLAALIHPAAGGGARRRRASDASIVLLVVLVTGAGHLGGTLTRGEGYLSEHMPAFLRVGSAGPLDSARLPASQAVVYQALVRPVLGARCVSCHGPDRAEGELRLDTPEGLRAGGSSGPVLVAGRAASSELVRRIWLPASHEDAMPPKGRTALTVAEASLLRWWIDTGASFDARIADVEVAAEVEPAIEAALGPLEPGAPAILAVQVAAASPAAIAKAAATGLSIAPLASGTHFLQVDATNVRASFGDAELEALLPLAPQVTWLALGATRVTDRGVQKLAAFPNLTRLHLDRTAVTDAALTTIARLARLEYLNLYGTGVTDAGIDRLGGMASLRDVYLWQTGATAEGVATLRARLPRARIDLGAPQLEVRAVAVVRNEKETPAR